MATRTNPTAISICTESLAKAGRPDFLGRARDEWLFEVLGDIWTTASIGGNTRLKTLQYTSVAIGTIGQRRYALPSDFSEEINVSILDWTHTDTSQSGSSNTITLAADEDATEEDVVGNFIVPADGNAIREYKQVTAYNTTTKIATIVGSWDSNPSTDTYRVIDNQDSINEVGSSDIDEIENGGFVTGKPSQFAKFADELIFDKPFDKDYPIRCRYYANIYKLDLAESSTALISKIYLNWYPVLSQGVLERALPPGSREHSSANKKYESLKLGLIQKELPRGGEFEGFTL